MEDQQSAIIPALFLIVPIFIIGLTRHDPASAETRAEAQANPPITAASTADATPESEEDIITTVQNATEAEDAKTIEPVEVVKSTNVEPADTSIIDPTDLAEVALPNTPRKDIDPALWNDKSWNDQSWNDEDNLIIDDNSIPEEHDTNIIAYEDFKSMSDGSAEIMLVNLEDPNAEIKTHLGAYCLSIETDYLLAVKVPRNYSIYTIYSDVIGGEDGPSSFAVELVDEGVDVMIGNLRFYMKETHPLDVRIADQHFFYTTDTKPDDYEIVSLIIRPLRNVPD